MQWFDPFSSKIWERKLFYRLTLALMGDPFYVGEARKGRKLCQY
jgi:hypothetical protein